MIERSNKSIETKRVTGLVYPKSGSDAANVKYVDDKTSNIQFSSILNVPSGIVSSSAQVSKLAVSDLNGLSGSISISAGTNITLTSSSNSIVINSSGGGAMTSVGSGSSLLSGSNGAIKSIKAGSNISFTDSGTDITINSTGGSGTVTVVTASLNNQTILTNFSSSQQATIVGLNLAGNNWGVNVIEEWDTNSGDQYYNSCSVILHFSGSNGSTTFVDNSINTVSISATGTAAISTTQAKFNTSSLYLNGVNGNYLTIPVSSGGPIDVGNGNFTVEGWMYLNTTASGIVMSRYNSQAGSGNYNWTIDLNLGTLRGQVSQYNSNLTTNDISGSIALATGSWHHFAYVYSITSQSLYVNGNPYASGPITVTTANSGQAIRIGTSVNLSGTTNAPINGYLDDIRITKNVARYTSSFTIPSSEYPNNAIQYATKYVGTVGGLNDAAADYGVQKITDTSLIIKKISATTNPVDPAGGLLSGSVNRVYVNILNYNNNYTSTVPVAYGSKNLFYVTSSISSFIVSESFTANAIDVYLNGFKLIRSIDYVDSIPPTIYLTKPILSGSVVEYTTYSSTTTTTTTVITYSHIYNWLFS